MCTGCKHKFRQDGKKTSDWDFSVLLSGTIPDDKRWTGPSGIRNLFSNPRTNYRFFWRRTDVVK